MGRRISKNVCLVASSSNADYAIQPSLLISFNRSFERRAKSRPILAAAAVSVFVSMTSLRAEAAATFSTWNNTGTDFNTVSDWNGGLPSTGNSALFSGAAVAGKQPNVSANIATAGINFEGAGYDITNTNSAILTLSGYGSSAVGVTASAAASVYLGTSGTDTFDVPVTFNPGSHAATIDEAANSGNLVFNKALTNSTGSLSLIQSGTSGSLVFNTTIANSGGITLTESGAGGSGNGGSTSFAQTISGVGSLSATIYGGTSVSLLAANTYSGGTSFTISNSAGGASSVILGDDAAFGNSSGAVTVGGAVTISGTAARTIANPIILTGSPIIGGSYGFTFSNTITDSGANRTITTNTPTSFQGNIYLATDNTARTDVFAGSAATSVSGSIINNTAAATSPLSNSVTILNTAGVTFSNANTYLGNTNVGTTTASSGILDLSNSLAIQNSTLVPYSGGSVVFDSSVTSNAFTAGALSASSSATAGNISLMNNASTPAPVTFTVGGNGATTTYGGALSGAGTLVKVGAGTLTLTSASTLTGGITVLNSFLTASTTSVFNGAGLVFTLDGGTFTYSNSAVSSASFPNSNSSTIVLNPGGGTLNFNNTTQTFAIAATISGAGALTKIGVGTLVLNAVSNSYRGGTTISAGTVSMAYNNDIPPGVVTLDGGALNLLSNTELYSSRSITITANNGTLSSNDNTTYVDGVISGGGMLNKAGLQPLVLTGKNTYTGGTNVVGGVLVANNSTSSLGAGVTSVSGGTTLAGSGATGGDVNVASTATITAGSGVAGTIGTLGMNVGTFNGGSTFVAKIITDGVQDGSGTTNDQLKMTGFNVVNASSTTPFAINLTDAGSTSTILPPLVVLITDRGDSAGVFLSALGNIAFNPGAFTEVDGSTPKLDEVDGTDGSGSYEELVVAAPEPTCILVAPIISSVMLMRRRRRIAQED